MAIKVISATPSPYARKVRIQLLEKKIPFDLQTEVPWDSTTQTPRYNPLEKLPVVIFDDKDNQDPIYESHYCVEWIERKLEPVGTLTPKGLDDELLAKKLEVIADAVCDALVLVFFEKSRGDKKSEEWMTRQTRKIEGGLKSLEGYVVDAGCGVNGKSNYVVGGKLSFADIAVVTVVDFLALNEYPALEKFVALKEYARRLNEERESFKSTMPYMFEIKDKIV